MTVPAAEIGPGRFDWWPDWRGQAVAIIACGPSLKAADVELLRGRLPVIAIKEAHTRLAKWSDVVYGCDGPWWNHVRGLPNYKGLKITWNGSQVSFPGLQHITISDRHLDKLILDEPGVIGAGGNSGFQALNLASQFGANRILLLGYDMQDQGGAHFYGRNFWMGANNPDASVWNRWRRAFGTAAKQLREVGVDVVNCTEFSALDCFKRARTAETLDQWRL